MNEPSPLRRLKIQGDSFNGHANRVWIDDDEETSTVTSIVLDLGPEKINEATIGVILPSGIDVDTRADIRINEQTSNLLAKLGWVSPEKMNEAVTHGEISINAVRRMFGLPPWPLTEPAVERTEPRTHEYPVGAPLADEQPAAGEREP